MNTRLREISSLIKLIADSSVGTKYNLDETSAALRLISSGIVSSNDLRPASTWPTGICNLTATNAPASTALVSP